MRSSTKGNWEDFWRKKSEIREVYANSDRIRRNLLEVTGDIRGKRILEVGAGTGRDSFYMAGDGASLCLLDYAHNSLRIIRNMVPAEADVTVLGGDAFSLPFRDGTFDVVFHQGLLEHFRKPAADAMLRENVRVLKRGGLLIVDVPQRWHVYTVVKHILIWMNAWFAGWEREFSVRELRRKLEDLQLSCVRVYGEWMYPSFAYRTFRELLLKFGLKLPLYPVLVPPLSRLRTAVRSRLERSPIKHNTALSIGIIAMK